VQQAIVVEIVGRAGRRQPQARGQSHLTGGPDETARAELAVDLRQQAVGFVRSAECAVGKSGLRGSFPPDAIAIVVEIETAGRGVMLFGILDRCVPRVRCVGQQQRPELRIQPRIEPIRRHAIRRGADPEMPARFVPLRGDEGACRLRIRLPRVVRLEARQPIEHRRQVGIMLG
jgi:hypothetical protein